MSDDRRPRPWESEQAAFSFLLRAVGVLLVVIVVILVVKAIA